MSVSLLTVVKPCKSSLRLLLFPYHFSRFASTKKINGIPSHRLFILALTSM